jgi:hypothetical protein
MENTEQIIFEPGSLLRARDVMKELNVSRTTAYRLMREMPYFEFSPGIIRVSVDDLMEFKNKKLFKNHSKVE